MISARKTTTFALVVVGLVLALALLAFGVSSVANSEEPTTTEGGVTPQLETDNVNCAALNADSTNYPSVTSDLGFKIDANPSGGTYYFQNGTQNGDTTTLTGGAPSDPSNSVTITPTAFEDGTGDTTIFDWTATLGIDAVIVKAQDSNVYVYTPEDFADSGLQAPELKGISHVDFCYDYELTASKTANATYTRTYSWTIDKSVSPDSHTGLSGDSFTSNYRVDVDQTVTDSNVAVSGTITVNNPTPITVSFSAADSVGGNAATVNCPTNSLAPGASTTCTYNASLDSKTNGTNTATITSNTSGVGGASASANYAFGGPTNTVGPSTITVTDSHEGSLGSASGDKTFTYSRNFSCSNNPADYTNGADSDIYPNTATIVQTNQSDDASVSVNCTLKGRVTVKKTTDGVVNPSREIKFLLTGPGLPSSGVTLSTLNDADGVLDFGYALVPGSQYTVCEKPVPAGFTSFWKLDGVIVTPYNPDAALTPAQDLGTRCFNFSATAGQTRAFDIDNSHPGGEPRTIGYWKNWNKCTSGNQSATAAKNGGSAAGVFIIEDLLPQTVGNFTVDTCAKAVKVLSKQDQSGTNRASDAAYELAAQLLAARFNLAAGAETCTGVQNAVVNAQTLLASSSVNFTGTGSYLTKSSTTRTSALSLAATLDKYNNGNLC